MSPVSKISCFALAGALFAACAGEVDLDAADSAIDEPADINDVTSALGFHRFSLDLDIRYHRLVIESEFDGADGFPVRYKWYEHLGRDEAYVVFINGRAEFLEKHDAHFTDVKEFPLGVVPEGATLADLPITFVALDVTGQGASKEGRVASHIDSFDTYVDDVRRLFRTVRKLERHRKPIYLMAHSQGALVAARFAQLYPDLVDGLIAESPFWGFYSTPELPAEAIRGIADFFTFGVSLPKLCSRPEGVTPETLGGIAQCATGALGPACQACFAGEPCEDPTGQFLFGEFEKLAALEDGCSDFGFSCPFDQLTDDPGLCEYASFHPLSGPSATMGYLSAAFAAQEAFAAGPPISVPTVVLSNPDDVIVGPGSHTCDNFSGSCEVITFDTPAHELFTGLRRPESIGAVRDYLDRELH